MTYAPAGVYFFVLHNPGFYATFNERLAQYPSIKPIGRPSAIQMGGIFGMILAHAGENTILVDEAHGRAVAGLEDLVASIEIPGDDD